MTQSRTLYRATTRLLTIQRHAQKCTPTGCVTHGGVELILATQIQVGHKSNFIYIDNLIGLNIIVVG